MKNIKKQTYSLTFIILLGACHGYDNEPLAPEEEDTATTGEEEPESCAVEDHEWQDHECPPGFAPRLYNVNINDVLDATEDVIMLCNDQGVFFDPLPYERSAYGINLVPKNGCTLGCGSICGPNTNVCAVEEGFLCSPLTQADCMTFVEGVAEARGNTCE